MANLEIIFGDQHASLHVEDGENLLQVLRGEGIFLTADCNGTGTCGKCKVKISDHTKRTFQEVLSCRTEVFDRMIVDVPESNLSIEEISSSKGNPSDCQKPSVSRNPSATDNNSATDNPSASGNVSVIEKNHTSAKGIAVDLGTTTIAANLIRLSDGAVLASCQEWNLQIPYGADVISRVHYIMQHKDGLQTLSAIARKQIDTIVHSLCQGNSISQIPVMISGNTIMQHIFAGIDPSPMATAPYMPTTLFVEDSFDFTHIASNENSSDFTHIAFNDNSSGFTHIFSGEVSSSFEYHLTPCISAFIGGDITAGLYDTGLSEKDGNWLFLDIGTNGEMALGGKDGFLCASVATGPAFEGAQIEYGCYRRVGAVSHVRWNLLRQELEFEVIGENNIFSMNDICSMNGICGSGLIDLLAVLTELGIISNDGRIRSPYELEVQVEEGLLDEDVIAALENQLGIDFLQEDSDGNGIFYLNPDSDTPVYLCTKDVHNLLLAKASVRAGVEILLKEKKLTPDHLDGIILSGGFGSHLNLENVEKIGMLPPGTGCKIIQAGNTSLHGAGKYLMDCYQNSSTEAFDSKDFDSIDFDLENFDSIDFDLRSSAHKKLLHIQELCNYIELADTDEFAEFFIQYLPVI